MKPADQFSKLASHWYHNLTMAAIPSGTLGEMGEDEIEVPKMMRCPVCGTNPNRCEKPLTDEERVCFSCGRELVKL